MTNVKTAEVMVKVVELLTPLTSEERQRVVQASLTLLGDTVISQVNKVATTDDNAGETFLPKARAWMKQNSISIEMLEEIFHFSGEHVEIIAGDVPGNSDKEKTHNVYILTGLLKLFSSGEAQFEDKLAREICKNLGCLNEPNHAAYMKAIGNELTGSKEKGWILTSPGLRHAASLIRELVK